MDDAKGLAVEFVHTWLTSNAMATRFAVGEYFDNKPKTLNWWGGQSGMMGRCNVFDFSLGSMLATMYNNSSRWDMGQLDHAGPVRISPANAATFIDNRDTDLSFPVIWNRPHGYAYILTSEGYLCVFSRTIQLDHGCYALKQAIDNVIWIHENLAFGSTIARFKDFQAIVYERQGFPNLVVVLHNDQFHGWRTLTVQTSFGPNVDLHDHTGHAGDVTDGGGAVTIGIPPNDNGTGYVAYSRAGFGRPFAVLPHRTMQTFAGDADLDIGPVTNAGALDVGRIWCAADSSIEATLNIDPAPWGTATPLRLEVLGAGGTAVLSRRWTAAPPSSAAARGRTRAAGWHTARLSASSLRASGELPFELSVTYSAPQTLE